MTRRRPPAPIAGSCARAKAAPVRDLALVGFLAALLALGFKRPFLFVLAYAYVDIVSPQRLSYYLLNSIPVSMIVAGLAFAGWLIADDKRHFKVTRSEEHTSELQSLMRISYAVFCLKN